jgi:Ca-activated chloride channel family protein
VTTSTIGIGLGYDEAILAEVAIGGTGNHAFAHNPDDAAAAVAAEVDGLLSKTVQAANLLIAPTGDVSAVTILNDVVANRVEGGILVELGDFYAGEQRRITCTIDVPAMAALGLAQVATLTLTHVEVATLEQHVVTLPVTVNVVPLDVARGRVPSPEVTREKLFLAAQSAKRSVEEALRSGDVQSARARLAQASALLTSADMDDLGEQLENEVGWLDDTADYLLDSVQGAPPDVAYASRRVSSDRARKSRGYKSRTQGGETTSEDAIEEA